MNPAWHADALCAYAVKTGYALPDDWFAYHNTQAAAYARKICLQCPVRELCLDEGKTNHMHGRWGGVDLTPKHATSTSNTRRKAVA